MLVDRQFKTTPPKRQSEISEQFCKKKMDIKNCGSKVVGSRCFFLSMSLCNNWHTIVLTGARMKPPKEIKCVLVKCNYFLKTPRKMKGCPIMNYIQEHLSDS